MGFMAHGDVRKCYTKKLCLPRYGFGVAFENNGAAFSLVAD